MSQAGKEILIKAVASAIPVYIMQCLKVPKKIYEEINSFLAAFWWEQQKDERKLHWISWFKLTDSKRNGGMGFKDFTVFNTALLAKQCWRILQRPDALWVRVLKGLYFPNCSILEAKKGSRASWPWVSILEGMDFMKQHLRWQIRDGKSVRIWEHIWIPSGKLDKPEAVTFPLPEKVAEIISSTKTWNLQALHGSIPEAQVKEIMRLPIPLMGGEDTVCWPDSADGKYTVKNGYQVIKAEADKKHVRKSASSSHYVSEKVWKWIWSLEVPPKIRNFLWRMCKACLSVKECLKRKKLIKEAACPLCGDEEESVEHMLLFCPWTKCVWFGGALGLMIPKHEITTMDVWLEKMIQEQTRDKDSRWFRDMTVAVTLWNIWKQRCSKVHGKKEIDPVACIKKIADMAAELISCGKVVDERPSHPTLESCSWSKPSQGSFKINCDGSFKGEEQAGIGVVIRNDCGAFVKGLAKSVSAESALIAEATAVLEGIDLAISNRMISVEIEMDSEILYRELTNTSKVKRWMLRTYVDNIHEKCKLFDRCTFKHVKREANRAADWFAKEARQKMCLGIWVERLPSSLVHILSKDGLHAPPV